MLLMTLKEAIKLYEQRKLTQVSEVLQYADYFQLFNYFTYELLSDLQ